MKAKNVHIGERYEVLVSGKLAAVRIDAVHPAGGWVGTNLATGRQVRFRTARRLRCNLMVRENRDAYLATPAAERQFCRPTVTRPLQDGDYDGIRVNVAIRNWFANRNL